MFSFMAWSKRISVLISAFSFLLSIHQAASGDTMCIDEEREALLDIKRGFVDESNRLSTWGGNETDCCKWVGIHCNHLTRHVVSLNLRSPISVGYQYLGPYLGATSPFMSVCLRGKVRPSLAKLQYLKYLDLSGNCLQGFPKQLGSLSRLTYLNLSGASYPDVLTIPVEIANLSRLETLDLSSGINFKWYSQYMLSIGRYSTMMNALNGLKSGNLGWLSCLSSLKYVDLTLVDLSTAVDWVQSVAMLPSLENLKLFHCQLPMPKPLPSIHANMSKSLTLLCLGYNRLNNSIFDWLFNISTNLTYLDLQTNEFTGPVPMWVWDIVSLEVLDLAGNAFECVLPNFTGRFKRLRYLNLRNNKFSGPLPRLAGKIYLEHVDLSLNNFLGPIPDFRGNVLSLKYLNLSCNNLEGGIPKALGRLQNLQYLDLSQKRLFDGEFSEKFMQSVGQISSLMFLDISSNSFNGTISETHFKNLVNLHALLLSNNFLSINFSLDWKPPFQLQVLKLGSCHLGMQFPHWLETQTLLSSLDLSLTGISSVIPNWFWNHFNGPNIEYLNLSHNHLYGSLPRVALNSTLYPMMVIDLSSNALSGSIPASFMNSTILSLSYNLFSGSIEHLCTAPSRTIIFLDISNNHLSGKLPDCWTSWKNLWILNLANNNFTGEIPKSIGSLPFLQTLHLRHNKLNGTLPLSLKNYTRLVVLDLAHNNLSGNLPPWIGENLQNLSFLSLRSNKFEGDVPWNICHLQNTRVLDLSMNNLTGNIPRCFENYTAMSKGWSFDPYFYQPISLYPDFYQATSLYPDLYQPNSLDFLASFTHYVDTETFDLKGIERMFISKHELIDLIDLSSNKLTGDIPREITSLVNLISLNLSRNILSGTIPDQIGELKSLDTLDLSRNKIRRRIPSSMSFLSHLGSLDLSFNMLSGVIPEGTQLEGFDSSTYEGNPGLCGPPLADCKTDGPNKVNPDEEDDEDWYLHFFVSMAVGFALAFWVGFGIGTSLINTSCRKKCIQFFRCSSQTRS